METLSRRAMRLALNNTVVFVRQARVSQRKRLWIVLLAAVATVGACRSRKKTPPANARSAASAELSPVRPPPPPAATLPPPAAVPAPPHRGGALRFHLDGEPPNLMPLGDVEASALQVTSGLIYETLLDCSDGSYRPALAESWDVSDDRMRLAVRVRSGVRWHDHRAFGVLDVQATIEPLLRKGNDAAALRAELADVASLELVTERTIRFVLKRPSDLALRALCDVPILPDHIIRNVRVESAPIARQPVGTGPFRFAGWERGKRIRLERAPDYWGAAPGLDDLRARWGRLVSIVDAASAKFDATEAGVPSGGAVLVRPDGFIGFRAAPADATTMAALDAHLATYLVPDVVQLSSSRPRTRS